jgi:hypothetical protein
MPALRRSCRRLNWQPPGTGRERKALPYQKKRLFIFDEQSHYVIENTGSRLRTKPNKANFYCGKTIDCEG